MAHYTASIETPCPPAETFAYLSDFSMTQEWDPGVVEAQRLGDAPVGEGTEFRLMAEFLGRKAALTYRIVEFEPDRAVTLRGESATVVSLDTITFEDDPISGFRLRSADYLRMGEDLAATGLPCAFVFEGGYAVAQAGVNAVNVLDGFRQRAG